MAMEMAKAATGDPHRDALTYYQHEFTVAGMETPLSIGPAWAGWIPVATVGRTRTGTPMRRPHVKSGLP